MITRPVYWWRARQVARTDTKSDTSNAYCSLMILCIQAPFAREAGICMSSLDSRETSYPPQVFTFFYAVRTGNVAGEIGRLHLPLADRGVVPFTAVTEKTMVVTPSSAIAHRAMKSVYYYPWPLTSTFADCALRVVWVWLASVREKITWIPIRKRPSSFSTLLKFSNKSQVITQIGCATMEYRVEARRRTKRRVGRLAMIIDVQLRDSNASGALVTTLSRQARHNLRL